LIHYTIRNATQADRRKRKVLFINPNLNPSFKETQKNSIRDGRLGKMGKDIPPLGKKPNLTQQSGGGNEKEGRGKKGLEGGVESRRWV